MTKALFHYILFIALFILVQTSYAKSKSIIFEITTSEHVYAIGHPIDVIFETRNHSRSLSTLNLDKLKKNFIIHDYNYDKFEDSVDGELIRIENLVVRLYPKRAGTLEIPAFKLGQYKSKPIFLNIINDFNSSIQIRTTTVKKSYFQREPINIYVDVYYRQKKITSSIGKLSDKNFIISDVAKTEYTITDNGVTLPVDRFSWIVIPLIDGEQIINLPMVKTGGRRMYPSGKLKISVKSLPSTLPPLIPVSKQTIVENKITKEKHWINQVYYWSITTTGNGFNENLLEKIISKQLKSDSNIRYFPRTYKRTRIKNGSEFKTNITIPFKLYNTGNFEFPTIDLPFIDAKTGIIEHTFSNKLTLHATSRFNEIIKYLLAIFLFAFVLIQPTLKLIKRFYIKYRYRVCYYSLIITNNPKRLKTKLLKLTPHFNSELPLTIKDWEESAELTNPNNKVTLSKISKLLNKFNYGKRFTKNEISVLKKLVRSLI